MGSVISTQERQNLIQEVVSVQNTSSEIMQVSKEISGSSGELSVSFGYQCTANQDSSFVVNHNPVTSGGIEIENSIIRTNSSSFSCLSGAALSANATLANTNICNGLIGEEILPGLDSPKLFRRMASSPSLSRLDSLLSSSQSSMSTLGGSASEHDLENGKFFFMPMTAPPRTESSSFLSTMDIQIAGGAAGEDRVQVVCSEESRWLFYGVYDGFNGRDAADFLAGILYENIGFYFHMLEWHLKQENCCPTGKNLTLSDELKAADNESKISLLPHLDRVFSSESFRQGVMGCLCCALAQAESDFLHMVEQEMEDRPDLVSVGSCVLVVLLHGSSPYLEFRRQQSCACNM